ncbi:MAG: PHP domain-containing protein, partial [Pseudomonadota bacterium]|nr:PHP domain-containing protein [Pseudomonadota bacterium]
MAADTSFVHLRIHSDFSMVDGLTKVKPICQRVADMNMPAMALTDQMNFCGLVQYYGAAHSKGLKPLIGADLWVWGDYPEGEIFRLTALAMNNEGYQQIIQLISKAYLRGHVQGKPVIDKAWLAQHNEGIILLSGAREGDVGCALLKGHHEPLQESLAFYKQHFPDRFYLELIRTGRAEEEAYLHSAVQLAAEHDLPVVATNEVVFLEEENFEAHEIRVAIHDGYQLGDKRRPKKYSPQQYLRSAEEMQALFADIPEAL